MDFVNLYFFHPLSPVIQIASFFLSMGGLIIGVIFTVTGLNPNGPKDYQRVFIGVLALLFSLFYFNFISDLGDRVPLTYSEIAAFKDELSPCVKEGVKKYLINNVTITRFRIGEIETLCGSKHELNAESVESLIEHFNN